MSDTLHNIIHERVRGYSTTLWTWPDSSAYFLVIRINFHASRSFDKAPLMQSTDFGRCHPCVSIARSEHSFALRRGDYEVERTCLIRRNITPEMYDIDRYLSIPFVVYFLDMYKLSTRSKTVKHAI